ncbi:MAG TPA: hypothetical protein VK861_05670, partial [Bacteroidales bacterium]|nr:hypothetical protein [Bacteroidales bacterium]
ELMTRHELLNEREKSLRIKEDEFTKRIEEERSTHSTEVGKLEENLLLFLRQSMSEEKIRTKLKTELFTLQEAHKKAKRDLEIAGAQKIALQEDVSSKNKEIQRLKDELIEEKKNATINEVKLGEVTNEQAARIEELEQKVAESQEKWQARENEIIRSTAINDSEHRKMLGKKEERIKELEERVEGLNGTVKKIKEKLQYIRESSEVESDAHAAERTRLVKAMQKQESANQELFVNLQQEEKKFQELLTSERGVKESLIAARADLVAEIDNLQMALKTKESELKHEQKCALQATEVVKDRMRLMIQERDQLRDVIEFLQDNISKRESESKFQAGFMEGIEEAAQASCRSKSGESQEDYNKRKARRMLELCSRNPGLLFRSCKVSSSLQSEGYGSEPAGTKQSTQTRPPDNERLGTSTNKPGTDTLPEATSVRDELPPHRVTDGPVRLIQGPDGELRRPGRIFDDWFCERDGKRVVDWYATGGKIMGDQLTCFNCGKPGHHIRQCHEPRTGVFRNRGLWKDSHSRDPDSTSKQQNVTGGSEKPMADSATRTGVYRCQNGQNHDPSRDGDGDGRYDNCGEVGHTRQQCIGQCMSPSPQAEKSGETISQKEVPQLPPCCRCKQVGHLCTECPRRRDHVNNEQVAAGSCGNWQGGGNPTS